MIKKKMTIHEKAVRLVEGGIVEISGKSIMMRHKPYLFDPCFVCEINCLCHFVDEIFYVCSECDTITKEDCFLVLVDSN